MAAAAVLAVVVLAACADNGDDDGGGGGGGGARATLATRTAEAGAVSVKMTPVRIDASGAEIKVLLDTHSVDLGLDVAAGSRLAVGGKDWGAATWSGAGPGGHHREGVLRFRASGPAAGRAELSIAGLPEPVTAAWDLGGQ